MLPGTHHMYKRHKKKVILTLKIAVAAGLLLWLFSKVHWNDYVISSHSHNSYDVVSTPSPHADPQFVTVSTGWWWWKQTLNLGMDQLVAPEGSGGIIRPGFATTIRRMDRTLFALAVAAFALSTLVVGVRWWFLLKMQEIRISLWEAIRLTFLGQFFNAVVPGTVGGDLVKGYYVARHTPKRAGVLMSILVDRLLGLVELVMLAGVILTLVLATGVESFSKLKSAAVMVAIVTVLVVFLLAMLLSSRFRSVLHLEKLYARLSISHHMEAAKDAAMLYRQRLGGLFKAIMITFGSQIIWMSAIALLGMSLKLQTPWHTYYMFVPVIYIIGAIPVTPGGMGIIEAGYIEFFKSPQVGASMILALAMLARFVPVFIALPGLMVAITGPRLPKTDDIEAQLGIKEEI